MAASVGVREFRQDLAGYIDQTEPVTITRHGQVVGLFIPVHRDRKADLAAYVEAAAKADTLLAQWGVTEDEVVSEFESLRAAGYEAEKSA